MSLVSWWSLWTRVLISQGRSRVLHTHTLAHPQTHAPPQPQMYPPTLRPHPPPPHGPTAPTDLASTQQTSPQLVRLAPETKHSSDPEHGENKHTHTTHTHTHEHN